ERARGEARHDELRAGLALDEPPDHVELALERVLLARERRRRADERLADARHHARGGRAGHRGVDRYVAPAEEALALVRDDTLDHLLELVPPNLVWRQEERADAVRARGRQLVAELAAEERVGDLHEDAGAVARVGIRTGGAAVLEVGERGQRTQHRLV